jgi:hypothetical protein
MANEFSVAIQSFIGARIAAGQQNKANAEFDRSRIDALNDIKAFLADHFNAKIPRRICESLDRRQQCSLKF